MNLREELQERADKYYFDVEAGPFYSVLQKMKQTASCGHYGLALPLADWESEILEFKKWLNANRIKYVIDEGMIILDWNEPC